MVDFGKLVSSVKKPDHSDLLSLFESLDRQASHTELRTAQIEACRLLSQRRSEGDIILKLSTGAGKTVVGLLYLKSRMNETGEPSVYLCPTVQLVNQVLREAERVGISAYSYSSGQSQPHIDCTRGDAVIVCTYAKLFNAKSTFNRTDVNLRPCAMVLDDAHAGVEEIRSKFTAQIKDRELYRSLLGVFSSGCAEYKKSLWKSINENDPAAVYEVPYWIWSPLVGDVGQLLSENSDNDDLKFVWPFIADNLRWCRCVIGAGVVEIRPEQSPIEQIRVYSKAKHRLFMSATLADDTILVREAGCSTAAARNPIIPAKDRGLGERMVLAPSLFDGSLDRQWVMKICQKASANRLNIIVLCHSEKRANDWREYGASVFLGEQVEEAINLLRDQTSNGHLFVFVQRYDGVDLPDKMCRILVIDGMPLGEGVADRLDSSITYSPGGQRNRLIYRIEQGMGRAVRSHADYAAIILSGADLVNFVARKEVLSAMTIETQAQITLALDLAKIGKQEATEQPSKVVLDMLNKCLKRDEDWKQYYNEKVRKIAGAQKPLSEDRLLLAEAERRAFTAATANDIVTAKTILEQAVDAANMVADEKGIYLQKIANYAYELDKGKGFEIQRSAYLKQSSLFRPPNVKQRPKEPITGEQSKSIFEWFCSFENPNGILAHISELRARLSFEATPNTFEQAICDLAIPLGALGYRPENEYDIGPDDLWQWDKTVWIIEAKTKNRHSLHKKDAEQLLHSLEWQKQHKTDKFNTIPVIVSSVSKVDPDTVFPPLTRLITPDSLSALIKTLIEFYTMLIHEPPLFRQSSAFDKQLIDLNLTPNGLMKTFTTKLVG